MTTLTVDAYMRLSPAGREEIDAWLRSLGGEPTRTRSITVGADFIDCEELDLGHDGRLVVKDGEVVHRVVRYPLTAPAPFEAAP